MTAYDNPARRAAGEATAHAVALIAALEACESPLTVLRELNRRQLQNTLEVMAGMLHAALYEVADLRGTEPDPHLGLIGGWLQEVGLDAALMRYGLPPHPTTEAAP